MVEIQKCTTWIYWEEGSAFIRGGGCKAYNRGRVCHLTMYLYWEEGSAFIGGEGARLAKRWACLPPHHADPHAPATSIVAHLFVATLACTESHTTHLFVAASNHGFPHTCRPPFACPTPQNNQCYVLNLQPSPRLPPGVELDTSSSPPSMYTTWPSKPLMSLSC